LDHFVVAAAVAAVIVQLFWLKGIPSALPVGALEL
jgi:hypothetical protein